ncbi:MAG: DUF6504 family protein [Actinomycetota bacterium]|nr:DUF6504 family protein [Actinomycetota bacterium]
MRRYGSSPDAVHVQRRDDVPTQFLWRGRLYVISEVHSCWVEAGGWWRSPAAAAVFGADGDAGSQSGLAQGGSAQEALSVTPIPASPKWGQRAWGEPAPDVGAAVGVATIDDGERELWRVEASAGRHAGIGTYDLCFDWSAGAWSVVRVLD